MKHDLITDQETRKYLLSCLPSVHALQHQPCIQELQHQHERRRIDAVIRRVLNDTRLRILCQAYALDKVPINMEDLAEKVVTSLEIKDYLIDETLINASGVLFHPGTGSWNTSTTARRASELALKLAPYPKTDRTTRLLCELTGAEDALVTHSVSTAFFMAVQSNANGKEVIISRNQLGLIDAPYNDGPVDPVSICKLAGAKLVEAGATNKTRLSDYRSAISGHTTLIAFIRPSTYDLRGFTEESQLEEIVQAGAAAGVTVLYLAGDTTLRPVISAGYRPACSVSEAVRYGTSLIIATSGGLIGGPPCGLIFGSRHILSTIRRNLQWPSMQAAWYVRAGLEARLTELAQTSCDLENHPAEHMLTASKDEIGIRARILLDRLSTNKRFRGAVSIVERPTYLTNYRLPNDSMDSFSISFQPDGTSPEDLAGFWACCTPSFLVNYDRSQLLIDMRGVGKNQIPKVAEIMNLDL